MTCKCDRDNSWSVVNGYLRFRGQMSWPVLKPDCDGDPSKPENILHVVRFRWIGDSKPTFTGQPRDNPMWHKEILN